MKILKTNNVHLADALKRVVCIKFCNDITREPTKLAASSRIYADESMEDYLPDDNWFMTFNDKQLLDAYKDDDLRVQMESLTKPELLRRLYKICRDNLTPTQIGIIRNDCENQKIQIDATDVEHLLAKMTKCNNIKYGGEHPTTNLFILDADGNIRTEDCLNVIRTLDVSNWDDEMVGLDPEYLGDILVVFQKHIDWVDNDGKKHEDLCIYIKVDLNQTTGDAILLVTMHPADTDNYVD